MLSVVAVSTSLRLGEFVAVGTDMTWTPERPRPPDVPPATQKFTGTSGGPLRRRRAPARHGSRARTTRSPSGARAGRRKGSRQPDSRHHRARISILGGDHLLHLDRVLVQDA